MTNQTKIDPAPKRAAAYCRVSTLQEEQEGSYDTQVRYYQEKITADPSLELAGIYGDRGVSAGGIKKRLGFMKMMEDCRQGKIDIILTKSVSRFARNLADCMACLRELSDLNVTVEFENEGLRTDGVEGELLISLLSAMAQQELNEKSQTVRWTFAKSARMGVPSVRAPFGYRKVRDEKGRTTHQWTVYEPEAEKVRLIFDLADRGCSYSEICRELDKTETDGYSWRRGRVRDLLRHEAYIGDLLTNKFVIVDYLSRKQIPNRGIADQYYLENHHPPIVSREQFARVQRRKKLCPRYK